MLPLYGAVSSKIGRIAGKFKLTPVYISWDNSYNLSKTYKHQVFVKFHAPVASFIGQISRIVCEREVEHTHYIRLDQPEKSGLAEP